MVIASLTALYLMTLSAPKYELLVTPNVKNGYVESFSFGIKNRTSKPVVAYPPQKEASFGLEFLSPKVEPENVGYPVVVLNGFVTIGPKRSFFAPPLNVEYLFKSVPSGRVKFVIHYNDGFVNDEAKGENVKSNIGYLKSQPFSLVIDKKRRIRLLGARRK